jgi:hypothetical protein
VGHAACMWEVRGVYGLLVERPERTRPLVRLRRRWEGKIKIGP